jgi:hypothetical protein
MRAMNWRNLPAPLFALVLSGWAYHAYGWPGVAMVASGGAMWILLNFYRLVTLLKRAANRPIGFVDSAVMLNAKLRPNVPLMHVIALTRSLGQSESPKDAQPEIYTWTDGSQSTVRCEFSAGRLTHWALTRPTPAASDTPQ